MHQGWNSKGLVDSIHTNTTAIKKYTEIQKLSASGYKWLFSFVNDNQGKRNSEEEKISNYINFRHFKSDLLDKKYSLLPWIPKYD